jgi:membrane-associated phospholipid phosphatase
MHVRDRRVGRPHLVLLAAAAGLFMIAYALANRTSISQWELNLTDWCNDAPDWVAYVLWPLMQAGNVLGPIVIGIIASAVYGPRRGMAVAVSGIGAWFLAKFVKEMVQRGRPLEFIPDINVREGSGTGLGFVSGHTAVAFAIATALMPVLGLRGRIAVYVLASGVGVARVVYGVHLPLDIVGGAALGIMCGCVVDLVLLAIRPRRSAQPDPTAP